MSTTPDVLTRPDWPSEAAESPAMPGRPDGKLLTIFGTRPEIIKLAPIIRQFEAACPALRAVNVSSSQHTDLLYPFVSLFGVRIDHDLQTMKPGQTPNEVCAHVLSALDPILSREQPDMIVVQGDTTTALAGALAGFHRKIPVAHVEAGLRSGDILSPYPEEMNRRLITKLASHHFAATPGNRDTLLGEGVEEDAVFVTGNPVVDALKIILERGACGAGVRSLLAETEGSRRVVLTTHRRESFGEAMSENLRVIRRFVELNEDVSLVFPVHPNPSVAAPSRAILSGHPRIHLTEPLAYDDFIFLLSQAWLIVSDSGGVQEEAPSLGKPLLILRENTERPEAVASGVARLVGGSSESLARMLAEAHAERSWVDEVKAVKNPFGDGESGRRIARIIARLVRASSAARDAAAV